MSKSYLIGLLILTALAGYLVYQFFFRPQIKLPEGQPQEEKIVTEEGKEQKIFVTDGVKHSVPLDEIISGGPPRDGIPSIDSPKFISISEDVQRASGRNAGARQPFQRVLVFVDRDASQYRVI